MIKILVVDDEEPARARVRHMLKESRDCEIVAEAANGRQAIAAIEKVSPDLMFLDIQMPRMTGFELCEAIGLERLPFVVFVTAFNQFALQAFEVHAVDYLLKPFDRERFDKCLSHVRQRLRKRNHDSVDDRIAALLAQIKAPQRGLDRLVFKTDGKVIFIRPAEIDYVESDGNYVNVHAGQVTHYLRETLSFFEEQLPSGQFIRISRSVIVNLERVKEMQSLFYGDFAVILRDGTKLTMSRSYRDRLDSLQHRSRPDSEHE